MINTVKVAPAMAAGEFWAHQFGLDEAARERFVIKAAMDCVNMELPKSLSVIWYERFLSKKPDFYNFSDICTVFTESGEVRTNREEILYKPRYNPKTDWAVRVRDHQLLNSYVGSTEMGFVLCVAVLYVGTWPRDYGQEHFVFEMLPSAGPPFYTDAYPKSLVADGWDAFMVNIRGFAFENKR